MIFQYLVPMWQAFFQRDLVLNWWFPLIALAFLATVPLILKCFRR